MGCTRRARAVGSMNGPSCTMLKREEIVEDLRAVVLGSDDVLSHAQRARVTSRGRTSPARPSTLQEG